MKAVLTEAVNWHVRLHDSHVSDATRASWQRWLAADPQHAQAWARIEKLQQRLGQAPAGVTALTLENARLQRRSALKMFGMFLGVSVAGWQGYRFASSTADYSTHTGQRSRLTLADGSRLDLNTDTRVDVRFDAKQRLILLRHGEILVETAKDQRPLSVQTAAGRILALGTRFSVRHDQDTTDVVVAAHAVEVRPEQAPQQVTRVQAGQSLSFTASQSGPLHAARVGALAWAQGMLVTVDWRLADVVAELSRYCTGYFGCAPEVADLRLSGAFNLDDREAALASLEDALPIRIRRVTDYWLRVEGRTS